MKIRTKRRICIAVGWLCMLLLLGIVGGVDQGRLPVLALIGTVPTTAVFAFTMSKAGWIRWN